MIEGHNAQVRVGDELIDCPQLKIYTPQSDDFRKNGSFNLGKYAACLARCKTDGQRRLLKAMAFPYLYGGNMTTTQDTPEVQDADAARSSHSGDDMHTSQVRSSVQPRVRGSARPRQEADPVPQGRTDDGTDRMTMRLFRFGTARIDLEYLGMDFDFLRINEEKGCVELGIGWEVFSVPCHCMAEATALFNQTWGILQTVVNVQMVN